MCMCMMCQAMYMLSPALAIYFNSNLKSLRHWGIFLKKIKWMDLIEFWKKEKKLNGC